MSTKKKLLISIGTLCIAIIAAVGITFGVLAAQTQKVNNSFNVEYIANNVKATVSASYTTEEGVTKSSSQIVFVPADEQKNETLSIDKATLTANDTYVIYTYTFTNNNSTGGRSMTVAMTDSSTISGSNVIVTYLSSTSAGETADTIVEAEVPGTMTIAAGDTGYFYVMIAIADDTLDVNFNSSIAWTLNSVNSSD